LIFHTGKKSQTEKDGKRRWALCGGPAKRAAVARRDHNCGATHGALAAQHLL
jgi:hypothetical protein